MLQVVMFVSLMSFCPLGFPQNTASAGMTRRNTYVCSDRNNADRLSVIPNGKENRCETFLHFQVRSQQGFKSNIRRRGFFYPESLNHNSALA